MIAIIDYELGNLRSVIGAVEKVGFEAVISNRREDLEDAEKLILPGVGAFGDGMANLQRLGLVELLDRLVLQEKKPVLGICLGSQLMTRRSYEFGRHDGLGWVDAEVVHLEPEDKSLRVPHVGWDELEQVRDDILFKDIPDDALFYYVHSFYIDAAGSELTAGVCDYGVRLTSVFHRDNVYGTQFHPEKSQRHGLTMLKNFLAEG